MTFSDFIMSCAQHVTITPMAIILLAVETGAFIPIVVWILKIANGQKCQLRHDMLQIYYKHNDTKVIRQYEYENFVYLYEAYKALKGNSFIDKIYKEIQGWEVVS